jgi:competence protein ComEC
VAHLLRLMHQRGVRIERLSAGATVPLDGRTTVSVLWPPRDAPQDWGLNDTSLVLRIACDDASALLAGDLESAGQRALIQTGADVSGTVLLLPHHGSWRPELPEFVSAVGAKVLLASRARPPQAPLSGGEAAEWFYQRLGAARFHSTPRNGCLTVRFGSATLEVQTMR